MLQLLLPCLDLLVWDDIDVGIVDGFQDTLILIRSNVLGAVNTSYGNSVTWLHLIDVIIISHQWHGLWSIAFWNTFLKWIFNFNMFTGCSCILTYCLSVKLHLLWIISKVCFPWHRGHVVGSSTLPRSSWTLAETRHCTHSKCAIFISG